MKKVILSVAFIAIAIVSLKAQTSGGVANVKVNVVLNPTLSISLGSGANDGELQDEVTLEYKSAKDYLTGVDTTVSKQLKVTSIGSGYRLKATLSNGGKFTKVQGDASGQAEIDASQLLQVGIGGSTIKDGAANMDLDPQGSNSNASSSVLNKEIDMYYRAKELNEGQIKQILGSNANKSTIAKYTVDIVYSIEAN
ncbi:MAG TPA: hypothetical protein PKA53_05375 [Sphingobacterium sp.]|nr:hypothetical protein [Sphingobacterium sp.]